ncbi:hypothetical protein K469DRAFT_735155 [Zopfia rhizophila CBS 207.26]|uniref:Uncharacterized protein n=1 Tax=Zopfia rhizophila CBS 207.26 TaxID=1314779 RepID=A0A6A6ESV7_9PEZI|nr:hypothetical protein K469DRAFT_735155 [Zopfia rhizophila CBS 207.26]
MPLRYRRRPPPLRFVFRQEPAQPGEIGPPSPESPGTSPDSPNFPGQPESPDEPSPTGGPAEAEEPEEPSPVESSFPAALATSVAQVGSSAAAITSQATAPPVAVTSSTAAPQVSSQPASEPAPEASGAPGLISAPSSDEAQASTTAALAAMTDVNLSNQNAQTLQPSTTGQLPSAAETELAGGANPGPSQPQRSKSNNPPMSKAAEGALIAFTILGALALVIGAIIFLKRRRRQKIESQMRHGEDAFSPSNIGSLHTPETAHIGHLTRTTDTTDPLFAGEESRPTTVSTDPSRSRFAAFRSHPPTNSAIQPPMPSANPFADPPLNKSYDLLRGRPRSTTLTDRGSWTKNPFKDPISDRFDPFGELQEKARQERVRHMEELRLEQEYLEKERMGLGMPEGRKGSGVTVEGLGVLDRSGTGGYPR